ncbi:MAG: hypothetical protein FK731_15140, partial [Asgard group archaeon]|nr:hypothetical protein [Asgard group archaeon]
CGLFSAKTNLPFRAGKLAAERVVSQTGNKNPALCLVFFSSKYAYPELVEGITQEINPEIIAGCSTNGEIAAGYWRETVVAFSFDTDYMRFGIAAESNENLISNSDVLYHNFYERALEDMRNKILLEENKLNIPINSNDIAPNFGILFLPGIDTELDPKANVVIQNLRKFSGNIPLRGGTIGDDCNYEMGSIIYKDDFLENHTLLILGRSDLEFSMAQKHGYQIKKEFNLTKSYRNNLLTFDNKPASSVYFNELNSPIVEISDHRDNICAYNPLGIEDESTNEIQILFPMSRGKEANELTVSQIIPENSKFYFMEADLDLSRKASLNSIKECYVSEHINDPRAALIFSCVGRSTFYFEHSSAEFEEIKNRFKYTDLGGAYLYGTLCGMNNWVSEGTTSTLLIGNDIRKRNEY